MKFLKSRWMRIAMLAMLWLIVASCQKDDETPANFWVPGEFEPQESIWLSSPTVDYKEGWSMLQVQALMIKEIITDTKVDYSINEASEEENLKAALLALGVTESEITAQIRFHTVEHADLWVRDTGGTFMKNNKGEYRMVDFDFDAYRMKDYVTEDIQAIYEFDNDVSIRIANELNIPVVSSTLITEGGNLHFNGKGTVIAIEKSLLASNPGMTKAQIVSELKRVFNLKKVILIEKTMSTDSHPVLESPKLFENEYYFNLGVWHIDEMVTWLNPTTVLLPQVGESELLSGNPFVQLAHEALENAYETLSSETDQDGNPLTIVRCKEPGPIAIDLSPGDLMYDFLNGMIGIQNFPTDGSNIKFVLAASYMNYVVANDVVIIPKLYKDGRDVSLQTKDADFKQLMETHFPTRRVVQVDVDAITVGGGGMHCITQQMPAN